MASFQELRYARKRPVTTGRFGMPSPLGLRFVAFAAPRAPAKVVFTAAQLASHGSKTTNPAPAFVLDSHGAPQPHATSARRPATTSSTLDQPSFAAPRASADVVLGAAQLASHSSRTTAQDPAAVGQTHGAPQPRTTLTRQPAPSFAGRQA